MCNENIKSIIHNGTSASQPKCHFVHHFSPYLKLGPFHIEVKLYMPFRTVIHEFFTEKEMDWMLVYSKPRLSASRYLQVPESTKEITKSQWRYSDPTKKAYTVAKTVTTWFDDITWSEEERFEQISLEGEPLMYEVHPLKDPYSFTVEHDLMLGISRKIEFATKFNVTTRHGASQYQTTNYGLSGMVESHLDPWGYEMGVELPEDRKILVKTGDYLATFMGWFEDTTAGGGTAFIATDYQGVLKPKKGSAAFWTNLSSCHVKDHRATHMGCPVLKGSKWILNKWIYSWDQWKDWLCQMEPNVTISPFVGMSS